MLTKFSVRRCSKHSKASVWHGQAPVWFMRDDIRVKAVWALLGGVCALGSATGSANPTQCLAWWDGIRVRSIHRRNFMCHVCMHACMNHLYQPCIPIQGDFWHVFVCWCLAVLQSCGCVNPLAGSMQLFVEGLAFFSGSFEQRFKHVLFLLGCRGQVLGAKIAVCMRAPCELFIFTNVLHSRGPWLLDVELRRQSDCNVCGVEALTAILQQAEFLRHTWIPAWSLGCVFSTGPKQSLLFPRVCVCHQIYTFNIFIMSVHTLVFFVIDLFLCLVMCMCISIFIFCFYCSLNICLFSANVVFVCIYSFVSLLFPFVSSLLFLWVKLVTYVI